MKLKVQSEISGLRVCVKYKLHREQGPNVGGNEWNQ